MKKLFVLSLIWSVSLLALNDGFDFGEGCEAGSGSFEQQIEHYNGDLEKVVVVGEIPSDIEGLRVELTSDKDVDIRLYDGQNPLVHWPKGLLSGPTKNSVIYKDTKLTYSGYNGQTGNLGHEYIEVEGATPSTLTMKAFGYKAGYATVNYTWSGKKNCSSSGGEGNFTQSLTRGDTSKVGDIPSGINNLQVSLTSSSDLDIQLYGTDNTAIVSWNPKGLLSGPSKNSVEYKGMNIEWSGYNGDGTGRGNEYIKITGETTEALTMKVYGYEGGFAEVKYSWDADESNDTIYPDVFEPVCGMKKSPCMIDEEGLEICYDEGYFEIEKTFNSMCHLALDTEYTFSYEGECKDDIEANQSDTNGTNTSEENDTNYTEGNSSNETVPENCKVWFDGCNICIIEDNETKQCTLKSCMEYEAPYCKVYYDEENQTDNSTQQELEENLALWQSKKSNIYRYKYYEGGELIDPNGFIEVVVQGDEVTSAYHHMWNGEIETLSNLSEIKTIDQQFEVLQSLVNQDPSLQTEYHEIYGFPTRIDTDATHSLFLYGYVDIDLPD